MTAAWWRFVITPLRTSLVSSPYSVSINSSSSYWSDSITSFSVPDMSCEQNSSDTYNQTKTQINCNQCTIHNCIILPCSNEEFYRITHDANQECYQNNSNMTSGPSHYTSDAYLSITVSQFIMSHTSAFYQSDPSGTVIQPSQSIHNLGVIVDSDLSLSAHVSHITSVCFNYLRQLRLVRRSLTIDAAHVLVRAMIHSLLDYCNSLLAGLPTGQMSRLPSVLCAAARLVLGLPGHAPVPATSWLSFPQHVTFKLCLLTYKCLHGLAPDYLSRFCTLLTSVPGRPLLTFI